MGGVIALLLSELVIGQLGGCELYEEVVTHLDRKAAWACVQQHNALGSETALRRPMKVSLKDGSRVEGCPPAESVVRVWPKSKARRRIEDSIRVDAADAIVKIGSTSHRLARADARRLRALVDVLAGCKRCAPTGWTLGSVRVVAVAVPVKDDCDGLVQRIELFAIPDVLRGDPSEMDRQ